MGKVIFFIAVMIFFVPFTLKKMVRWQFAVPFFFLSCLIIFNAGLFDKYSFIDSDLVFHKSLADNLENHKLFENDKAMRFYMKVYPRGFHYFLNFLRKINLTVPQISKLLGLVLALITPPLFYLIANEVYRDKITAFLSGLFCGAASIISTICIGLPRSIAFVFFLLMLFLLFRYCNDRGKVIPLIIVQALLLMMLFVHPYTFIISWLVCAVFLLFCLIGDWKKNNLKLKIIFTFFFFNSIFFYVIKSKNTLALSSWGFFRNNQQIFQDRVPYAFVNLFNLAAGIGIVPIIMFIAAVFIYRENSEKSRGNHNWLPLNACAGFLILLLAAVLNVDSLFFMRAHRIVPFLSVLLFLGGIPVIKNFRKGFVQNKSMMIFLSFILLSPMAVQLAEQLKVPRYPYNLNINGCSIRGQAYAQPAFDEIISLAAYADKNIPEGELIACSLDSGDIVRMFVKRAVTASWKIGGMITVYKAPLNIYREQIAASKVLYDNPVLLYKKYKARFFLFEKGRPFKDNHILSRFKKVWESDNFYLYKIID